jgi:hydroxypyruvate isomerase
LQSIELMDEHHRWTPADLRDVRSLMRSYRMAIDVVSLTPHSKTTPVALVDPPQHGALLTDFERHLIFARELEIPYAQLTSGVAVATRSRQQQWQSLVEGCRRAGDLAARANVTLLVEPLNSRIDHPGYFLDNCTDGLKLIREVDHPHVRLLFDIYHEQVQSGNVTTGIEAALPFVKVFHVAGNPGRNDPGAGEIRYEHLYRTMKRLGFEGHVAMEYRPLGDPVASLIRSVDAMRNAMV